MKATAIVFLLGGLIGLAHSQSSECMEKYSDLTKLEAFEGCEYTLDKAIEENQCGFASDYNNLTLDLSNKLITSYKDYTGFFDCLSQDYELEVDLNENFIDCIAIPENDDYVILCDPNRERTCSSLREDECNELYTICDYKLLQCTRKDGVQKSPHVIFSINQTFTYDKHAEIEESLTAELTNLFADLNISTSDIIIKFNWILLDYRRRSLPSTPTHAPGRIGKRGEAAADEPDPDDEYRIEATVIFVVDSAAELQAAQERAATLTTLVASGNLSAQYPLMGKAVTTYVKGEKAPDEFVNTGKTYIGSGAVMGCIVAALVLVIIIIGEIVYLMNYRDTEFKGKPVPSSYLNVVYVDDDLSSDEESSSEDDDDDNDDKKKKKKMTKKDDKMKSKKSVDAAVYVSESEESDTYSMSDSETESETESESESETESEDDSESEEEFSSYSSSSSVVAKGKREKVVDSDSDDSSDSESSDDDTSESSE